MHFVNEKANVDAAYCPVCQSPAAEDDCTLIAYFAVLKSTGVAERCGCFQRCLFVCQHDNFRTIKRRTMKLGG